MTSHHWDNIIHTYNININTFDECNYSTLLPGPCMVWCDYCLVSPPVMARQGQGRRTQWRGKGVLREPFPGKRSAHTHTSLPIQFSCIMILDLHTFVVVLHPPLTHSQDPLAGIIPRSLHQLFEQLEAQVHTCTHVFMTTCTLHVKIVESNSRVAIHVYSWLNIYTLRVKFVESNSRVVIPNFRQGDNWLHTPWSPPLQSVQ